LKMVYFHNSTRDINKVNIHHTFISQEWDEK